MGAYGGSVLDAGSRQANYVEVWCEKDALTTVLLPMTKELGVTLVPCRGYQSRTALVEAAERFGEADPDDKGAHLLYFGDFDPRGEDMPRYIQDRLSDLGAEPDFTKVALTLA